MKRIISFIIIFLGCLFFCSAQVDAKNSLVKDSINDIEGNPIGTIEIYDNGEIVIGYRYGLRYAYLEYCERGNSCDFGYYKEIEIVNASEENPYKNTSKSLAGFSYKPTVEKGKEYRFKVTAYYGIGNNYQGSESLSSTRIWSLNIDTKDDYLLMKSGVNDTEIENEDLSELMSKLKEIVNTIIIPVLYAGLTILLVLKGAILGVQIVKSADEPQVRREKVGALKWLLIGVFVAYAATGVVSALTGFFKEIF